MAAAPDPGRRLTPQQQHLARSVTRLADYLAGPYIREARRRYGTVEEDDIRSDAYLAVVEAAATYEPGHGSTFSGYAGRTIVYRIVDGFRTRQGREGQRSRNRCVSLDMPIRGTRRLYIDVVGDDAPDATDAWVNGDPVRYALRRIPKRLRWVVTETMPYGQRTLLDVAREMGVTEGRVCQLRAEAFARLRDNLTATDAKERP